MPLLELQEDPCVKNFWELGTYIINMLKKHDGQTVALVIGRITDSDPDEIQHNLEQIRSISEHISKVKNHVVLDFTSFQAVIGKIISDVGITEYPFELLDHVTLRLIREGYIHKVYCMLNFEGSIGTEQEHNIAHEYGVFAGYVDKNYTISKHLFPPATSLGNRICEHTGNTTPRIMLYAGNFQPFEKGEIITERVSKGFAVSQGQKVEWVCSQYHGLAKVIEVRSCNTFTGEKICTLQKLK